MRIMTAIVSSLLRKRCDLDGELARPWRLQAALVAARPAPGRAGLLVVPSRSRRAASSRADRGAGRRATGIAAAAGASPPSRQPRCDLRSHRRRPPVRPGRAAPPATPMRPPTRMPLVLAGVLAAAGSEARAWRSSADSAATAKLYRVGRRRAGRRPPACGVQRPRAAGSRRRARSADAAARRRSAGMRAGRRSRAAGGRAGAARCRRWRRATARCSAGLMRAAAGVRRQASCRAIASIRARNIGSLHAAGPAAGRPGHGHQRHPAGRSEPRAARSSDAVQLGQRQRHGAAQRHAAGPAPEPRHRGQRRRESADDAARQRRASQCRSTPPVAAHA